MANLKDYETAADAERAYNGAMANATNALADKHRGAANLLNMVGLAVLSTPAAAVAIAWLVSR